MCAIEIGALRRNSRLVAWPAFFLQVLVAISFEVGDDLGRGLFAQRGTLQGIENARQLVNFEAAHDLWDEPAWQMFFLQTRHVFALTITWLDMAHIVNAIYVLGHVFFTLGVACWVYFRRHRYFTLLRNIIILTNGLALIVYENFPVAPPRLTTDLWFNHHRFTFDDTVFGILSNGGHLVGSQAGYNEFSAMPSVHFAWALVAGLSLVFLARPLAIRAIGVIYPPLMLLAVVVTGNHYFLDVAGGVVVVVVATSCSLALARWPGRERWPRPVRQLVLG